VPTGEFNTTEAVAFAEHCVRRRGERDATGARLGRRDRRGVRLKAAVPTLSDAVLLRASQDVWVLTDVERVASDSGDERVYPQTWLLTPVDRSS